jgi:hypothetical protein
MKKISLYLVISFFSFSIYAQRVVNESVEINVCFSALHTYVSDLGFYLVAPEQTNTNPGNYGIVQLAPAASNWGDSAAFASWTGIPWSVLGCSNPGDENTVCNSGNNVENFCFTTTLEAGNPELTPCICDMATPLTGTFASVETWENVYGFPIIGTWGISIFDCENIDYGSLTEGTISFSIENELSVVYTLIPPQTIPINDNSCDINSASLLVYSPDFLCNLDITFENQISNETVDFSSDLSFLNEDVPFEPFYSIDSIYISTITPISSTLYQATYQVVQNNTNKSGAINAIYELGEILPETLNLKLYLYWENTFSGAMQTIAINHEITNDSPLFIGKDFNTFTELNIFPNPATNSVTIENNLDHGLIYSIYSSKGKLVKEGFIESTKQTMSLEGFTAGIYYFFVNDINNSNSKTFNIVVE